MFGLVLSASPRYLFSWNASSLAEYYKSPVANLVSDIVRHAYDDTLCMKRWGGSDGALLCAGTFRGDSTYGPGINFS